MTAPNAHDVLLRIAKVTGVDPGWLAYGDDSQAPAPVEEAVDEAPKGTARHPLQKESKEVRKAPTIPLRKKGEARGRKHGS